MNEHGKRVFYVELYLDLVFVLAAGQLAHLIVDDPVARRVWIASARRSRCARKPTKSPCDATSALTGQSSPAHVQRGTSRSGCSWSSVVAWEFCIATFVPNSTCSRTASRNA